MSDNVASFVGRGIDFPLGVDASGGIALVGGVGSIERSMRMILATAPGERVMRPAFGCAIWDLLFESMNVNTFGLMAEATREALSRWEPRVDVEEVDVAPDPDNDGRVAITIGYVVRATNDHRNLVFPFYVIPEDEAADNDTVSGDASFGSRVDEPVTAR